MYEIKNKLGHVIFAGESLRGADLRGADLSDADLRGADLSDADLRGADLSGAKLPDFQIPQGKELRVWKRIRTGVIELVIPASARRTATLVGNKCRAERAFVCRGDVPHGSSLYDADFVYAPGSWVRSHAYNDDPRVAGAPGIHFFMHRTDAEKWMGRHQ